MRSYNYAIFILFIFRKGTTITFDLSCIQPANSSKVRYFDGTGGNIPFIVYLELFGLPNTGQFGYGNSGWIAGNTGSPGASLGNKYSAQWYYHGNATLGSPSLSVHYDGDGYDRTLQVDIVCDETATTPVYKVIGKDRSVTNSAPPHPPS